MILCCHEEIAVAVAHGYAKATGKIMPAIVHNVVGLQHASMAIYNAWCDHTPVMVMGGTGPMNFEQAPPVDRLDPYGAGAGQSGARLRQVGRPAGGRRGVSVLDHARLSHRHERSGRAGLSLLRRHRSGGRDRKRNSAARSETLSPAGAAASGLRRDQRSGAVIVVGAKSGDPRRLRGAEQRRGVEPGGARRSAVDSGHRSRRALEFPQHPFAQSHRQEPRADRQCRRHHGIST